MQVFAYAWCEDTKLLLQTHLISFQLPDTKTCIRHILLLFYSFGHCRVYSPVEYIAYHITSKIKVIQPSWAALSCDMSPHKQTWSDTISCSAHSCGFPIVSDVILCGTHITLQLCSHKMSQHKPHLIQLAAPHTRVVFLLGIHLSHLFYIYQSTIINFLGISFSFTSILLAHFIAIESFTINNKSLNIINRIEVVNMVLFK